MKYNTFTEEQLQHLSRLALDGDSTAYDMLLTEGKRIAKAANTRLWRLEKMDLAEKSYAYSMVELWKGERKKVRFNVNQSMDIDELVKELRRARVFMSQESSTQRGVKMAEKRFFDTLDSYDIHIPESDRQAFYEFVRSDSVQDVIDYIGEYDIIMDIIANNLDDIQNSFKNLQRQFDMAVVNNEYFDTFIERMGNGRRGQSYVEMYKRHTEREGAIRDRKRKAIKDFKRQASKL